MRKLLALLAVWLIAAAPLAPTVAHAQPASWATTYGSSCSNATNTYTTGTAATETVPAGCVQAVITGWGAGGSGVCAASGNGGGGAGQFIKTIAVVGGNTFTYTVPAATAGTSGGTGTAGSAATVTGTVSGGTVNLTGNGGAANITGGTASGGDTNTTGGAGTSSVGGNGANGGGSGGGSPGSPGSPPGGGGAPGLWTGSCSVNSGGGANGQISFAYSWNVTTPLWAVNDNDAPSLAAAA